MAFSRLFSSGLGTQLLFVFFGGVLLVLVPTAALSLACHLVCKSCPGSGSVWLTELQ